MIPQIIKDKPTYEATLSEINSLMDFDPEPSSERGKQLELLTHLVEEYERDNSSRPETDPIDAILFRMEQENLKQSDLVPFIGSRSKVSEVLSGKRSLTLSMIQALHSGLGIPADVLLKPTAARPKEDDEVNWKKFPLKEMCARGWLADSYENLKLNFESALQEYFGSVGGLKSVYARNKHTRAGREMNQYALAAWTVRVIQIALQDPPVRNWNQTEMNLSVMREIAKLSVLPDGPLEAQSVLKGYGISLVIEQALPHTYLDGSAIMIYDAHPIIGLTLRYDRVDNFWFTLMHELAHLLLHYNQGINQFYDDLDIKKTDDPKELEADETASEALIPKQKWVASPARVAPSKNAILRFAQQSNIHPAIVAGKIRRERSSYHLFNDLVGHGRIRYLFGLSELS